ncbi:MAG: DNA-directed RNA polymerase [Methanobrevibacter arboriphilus]|uniref:DNA-directed RNA polymerase n=2 Tax=Methanobrevibacter arboriphilus TaxID=39441 RepID=A0ACA8R5N3_METAZ|nr:DNA-directed RNA polymerase [Methanobrevibacter arboriphilus]MBF4469128.1 DNA-directed RNA polymerase [Methanobrevibacter arboriphilus]MCC7561555.1 DNA-directed RNA polymerase [Methanobrevibacter arboriphilus]BBL63012.1 DNA-directed RNA polymerase [Methanobrevibacter arboriphilus]GLI12103.1 DNA-directed RNA polymerase [Methanobrevibacter arboriphilus]
MYYLTKIEDTVRIPPYKFEDPLEEVAIETLNETYNGRLDKKLGLLVSVNNIEVIGEGKVIMGDGAAYHEVVFNAVFFKPELYEIIDGEVIEIAEFGAFIRIGPMDGLVHVSQVTDDYINYDSKRGALLAKESKKTLEEGNFVRARIVAVSLKGKSTKETRIGLTMRQPNLGRFEWIEDEKNKSKK